MFKKNKIIMFTALIFVGCFSIAQANYITYDPGDMFGKKSKKQSHMKKKNPVKVQKPIDLLTYGMKDKKDHNYSFNNHDWNAFGYQGWNAFTNINQKSYSSYKKGMNSGKHKGKHIGFKGPHKGKKPTSVPEPSVIIMLSASLLGLVGIRRSIHA